MYKAGEAGCCFELKILKSGFVAVFHRSESNIRNTNTTDNATDNTTDETTIEHKILALCGQPRFRDELMAGCGMKNKSYFIKTYLKPLIASGKVKMTIPDKPNSMKEICQGLTPCKHNRKLRAREIACNMAKSMVSLYLPTCAAKAKWSIDSKNY